MKSSDRTVQRGVTGSSPLFGPFLVKLISEVSIPKRKSELNEVIVWNGLISSGAIGLLFLTVAISWLHES
jgi:hypothetical protein